MNNYNISCIDKDIENIDKEFNRILSEIEYVRGLSFTDYNNIILSSIDKERIIDEVKTITTNIKNHTIPESFPSDLLSSYLLRDFVIKYMGFALVSNDWVKNLAKWIGDRTCLEIMGGKGVLSKALYENNVNIICTDDHSWDSFDFTDLWFDVKKIDCLKAIEEYKTDLIIISWPYMDSKAYDCLQKIREINSDAQILYIGDPSSKSTADDNFHKSMKIIKDNNIEYINSIFKSWAGINDKIYLVK